MVKFRTILAFYILTTFSCVASEQEVLVTTDFVLKAGASETRTLHIQKPEHLEQLVMVGFNPVKALSVDCVLRLYTASDLLLGSYNCAERQNHSFQQSLSGAIKFKAQIEVSNNNFTEETTRFSVINRFKFVSLSR
jgi:hypothetical protein